MRLFIAINFDGETRERLLTIQRSLAAAACGNFTRPENMHLTVLFLGEVEETSEIRRVMAECFTQSVTLEFDRVGTFRRNLYWVGVRPDPGLTGLYRRLRDAMRAAGFGGDWPDALTAHVTLAREVRLREAPDLSFAPFSMTARRLSLMKSERIAGRLTYTEIHEKNV